MELSSNLSVANLTAEQLKSLVEAADEDPGPDEILCFSTNHHTKTCFALSRLRWSNTTRLPHPIFSPAVVYANSSPKRQLLGFGTSFTDAAVIQLDAMPKEQAYNLLKMQVGFSRMRLIRVPMGSCDFSVRQYSF